MRSRLVALVLFAVVLVGLSGLPLVLIFGWDGVYGERGLASRVLWFFAWALAQLIMWGLVAGVLTGGIYLMRRVWLGWKQQRLRIVSLLGGALALLIAWGLFVGALGETLETPPFIDPPSDMFGS
jgi:hypothetical protein